MHKLFKPLQLSINGWKHSLNQLFSYQYTACINRLYTCQWNKEEVQFHQSKCTSEVLRQHQSSCHYTTASSKNLEGQLLSFCVFSLLRTRWIKSLDPPFHPWMRKCVQTFDWYCWLCSYMHSESRRYCFISFWTTVKVMTQKFGQIVF